MRFLFILLLVANLTAFGRQKPVLSTDKQLTQFALSYWTTAEGLHSNTLIDVCQASDGYIWVSGYGGLSRFDGIGFSVFGKKNNGHAFYTNTTTTLYQDKDDVLWVGTEGSGLLSYKNGTFTGYGQEDGFVKRIEYLFEDKDNTIWLGTRGAGVWTFDRKKIHQFDKIKALDGKIVQAIAQDPTGALWFGTTNEGIFIYQPNKEVVMLNLDNGLPSNKIQTIFLDSKGVMWIGTDHGGMKYAKGKLSSIEELEEQNLNCFYEDAGGNIWIGTHALGLIRHHPTKRTFEYLSEKQGLPHKIVKKIISDHEGSIWLTTYQGGLVQLKDGKFVNFSEKDGLSGKIVNTYCEMPDGSMLVGVGGKINRIAKGVVSEFPLQTPLDRIMSIVRSPDGNLWIASEQGLVKKEPSGKEIVLNKQNGQIPDNSLRCLSTDSKGNVWAGSRSGGLWCITPTGQITIFNKSSGFPSDFIMSVDEYDGEMVVGTNDTGLCFLKDGQVTKKYAKKDGLPSNLIFNVYRDADKVYWLTTNAGLARLKDGKITAYSTTEGLTNDSPFDILEDNKGNLWITSAQGVFTVTKQVLHDFAEGKIDKITCRVYGKYDGMRQEDCTGATEARRASNGHLWFPTLDGVAIMNPEHIPINKQVPPVNVNAVLVDMVQVDNKLISPNQMLEFEPGKKRFVFHYTALSLLAPQKTTFKYKLEGFDKEWIEVDNQRSVTYTNLPYGQYTFRVLASNNDKIWNEEGASVSFYLKPFFYETKSFYVLCVVLLAFAIGLIYRWRTVVLQRKNEELEGLVQKRTHELAMKQEEILTQNEELQQQQEEITAQRDFIEQKNVALTDQKEQLERAYKNVSILTEVGQELTSILDLPTIIMRTYERVNELMDASGFGIGIYDPAEGYILFKGYIEKGEVLPTHETVYDPANDLGSQCIEQQREIFINDLGAELGNYLANKDMVIVKGEMPNSLVYLPLTLKGKKIGVITVQSFEVHAYSDRDLTLLRSLATYVSIAVDNAESYHEVKKAHEVITAKNKDIMDSLRYAETIQKSVLPIGSVVNKYVAEHFAIFKPKDVVSGDFYWFNEVNGRLFAAVVDCTGHGVPGAFMSLIGHDLLDTIILREKIFDPALVLQMMNAGVRGAFQQDQHLNSDGMDVCLCMIEYKEAYVDVTFAGAKRPLFFTENQVLKEERGDRKSVGGRQKDSIPVYTNQLLRLHKGDTLYLTTDGFADQHGASGKKYGTNKLWSVLEEIMQLPLPVQEERLLSELQAHQEGQLQRDDITLFGIRL